MAFSGAVRSAVRSSSFRTIPRRVASEAKAPRSPSRMSSKNPLSHRNIIRSPVEMSFCIESMLPYHTATASALMTSMLSISRYGRLPEVSWKKEEDGKLASASALKLVHEGGKVEFYYMAELAAKIMEKYPSFILARPQIYRRPWESVVGPEDILYFIMYDMIVDNQEK